MSMPSLAAVLSLAAAFPVATDPAAPTETLLHCGLLFDMKECVACRQDGRAVRE
jgi:hypothetical protein